MVSLFVLQPRHVQDNYLIEISLSNIVDQASIHKAPTIILFIKVPFIEAKDSKHSKLCGPSRVLRS